MLDLSKLKEFADDNYKFDENGRKFSKRVENTVEKRRNTSLSHSVFKRLNLQISKKQCLFGKGLRYLTSASFSFCKYWVFNE